MTRRTNWWLTGIGLFTALLFGTLAIFTYQAYQFRGELFYLISVIVYAGIAIFSIGAVIKSWRSTLPVQSRADPDESRTGEERGES